MAAVINNPQRQQGFIDAMRKIVSDMIMEVLRVRSMVAKSAYLAVDYERAGNS
jgi:hypothetical protein